MTTLALREHTVMVADKPMFVAEAGDWPPRWLLPRSRTTSSRRRPCYESTPITT